jgi:hypothetical protein
VTAVSELISIELLERVAVGKTALSSEVCEPYRSIDMHPEIATRPISVYSSLGEA